MKAAIYCRTSTEAQASEHRVSIPEQLEACEALCQDKRYQIIERHIDAENYRDAKGKLRAPSGQRKDRPAYEQLITDALSGEFDVIVAWKEDRLYRGIFAVVPFGEMLEAVERQGRKMTIDFVHGTFDEQMLYIKAAMAKIEIENMQARMMMGKRGKAKRGQFPGCAIPYGYGLFDGQLIVNEEETNVVRQIFNLYIEGLSIIDIARRLNTEGIPTKRQSRHGWHRHTVWKILRSPRYYGEWQYDGVTVSCPAIVTRQTWELAQGAAKRRRRFSPRNTRCTYLLQHLLYCEECGNKITVNTIYKKEWPHTRSYQCPTSYNYPGMASDCAPLRYLVADALETVVWTEIDRKLREPELVKEGLRAKLAQLEEARNEAKARAATLERKLTSLESQRQTVIRWARMGHISEKDMATQLQEIAQQSRAFREDLERATQTIALKREALNTQDLTSRFYERIKDRLEYLKVEPLTEERLRDRRELAKILLHRVWINKKGEIRIEGHIPEVREETFFTSSLPRYR